MDDTRLSHTVHCRNVTYGHKRQRVDDGAYGWAFVNPIRKLWYNLTITAASVVVALFIGGVEVFGLIGDKLSLEGWFWTGISRLNDNLANFGFVVVGIFIASWIVSAVIYRVKGFDNLQVGKT